MIKRKLRSTLATSIISLFSCVTHAQQMVPFKDSEFKHPRVQRSEFNGDFQQIYYDELKHVNGRDRIPVTQALESRVYVINRSYQRSARLEGLQTHYIGNLRSADFIVIFIHGGGGNRDLGFDDWTFGGNFNRLKNLSVRSNGAYISPSVRLSSSRAYQKVGKMLAALEKQNSNVPIIMACGSAGGQICLNLAQSKDYSTYLSGLILLGSAYDIPSLNSPFIQSKKPIVIAHGSKDPVLPWNQIKQSFVEIKNTDSNYPIKYFLFNGGLHGTPIRMIDWRSSINWILQK